jgi:hypothetical protein
MLGLIPWDLENAAAQFGKRQLNSGGKGQYVTETISTSA